MTKAELWALVKYMLWVVFGLFLILVICFEIQCSPAESLRGIDPATRQAIIDSALEPATRQIQELKTEIETLKTDHILRELKPIRRLAYIRNKADSIRVRLSSADNFKGNPGWMFCTPLVIVFTKTLISIGDVEDSLAVILNQR